MNNVAPFAVVAEGAAIMEASALGAPYAECHAEHQSNDPIEDTHTIVTGDDYVYVGVCAFCRRAGAPAAACAPRASARVRRLAAARLARREL